MTGLICLALLATSCRRLPYAPPTVKPTITPTPRSTALPPIPTAVPLGSTRNPLHIVFVALPDVASEATPAADATEEPTSAEAAADLEKALLDAAQLTVTVDVVNSDAEALTALCASPKGTVSAAWMGGLAYAAAFAQECGSAALQIERGTGNGNTGDQARIITGSDKITAIADLADHTFCRLGYSDVYSWLIPSLMIHKGGVADSDMKAINDYTDPKEMIADVLDGKCDAAGISNSLFNDIANASARTSLRTLEQSAAIPFEVLVVPPQLAFAEQQQLINALIAIGNGTRAGTLKPLLNQDQVIAASDDDLSTLRSFVSGAGIDLAQAGN